jgi:hypothetical protein
MTPLSIVNTKGKAMTQSQALTNALILALIAPSDEKASQASELAESIAKGLDFDQVEQCKADALTIIEATA